MKHYVDLKKIVDALKIIKEFDALPFDDICFQIDGENYEFNQEQLDLINDWKYVGLNNRHFVQELFA